MNTVVNTLVLNLCLLVVEPRWSDYCVNWWIVNNTKRV